MKKILLLTISLFLAYSMSFGQTNGTGNSCSDAILLDHSQPTSCSSNTNTNEMWYEFVADTTYMEFSAHEFMESGEITLYSGTCSNLTQLFQIDDEYLIYSGLTINTTYYIQVIGTTTNDVLDVCLSNFYGTNPSPSEVCEPLSDCNKVANGNFTSNTCTYPDLLFALPYNFEQGAFQDGEVFAWTRFLGTPDMYNENIEWANMWTKTTYSGDPCSEAIITCTSIEPNEIYILSLDYKRTYVSASDEAITTPTAIMVDIADNQVDGFMANSSIMPTYTSPVQNIFNSGSISSDVFAHADNLFTYTGPSTMDRLIVYGQSSSNGNRKFGVDNITITPIIYDDFTTCLNTVTLEPTCLGEIQNLEVYSNLTFTWAVANGPGSIIADGNQTTLMPNVELNGDDAECKLTVTNIITGETFFTYVNITYEPLKIVLESITDVSCNIGYDGAIDISVYNGTADYTYNWISVNGWSSSATGDAFISGDITHLVPSLYSVFVTDANGCEAEEIKIPVSEAIVDVTINSIDTWRSQNCGVVEVISNTPSSSFSYNWEDASGVNIGTSSTVFGLPVGDYFYTVTDLSTGCTVTNSVGSLDPVSVNEGPSGNLSTETHYLCEGSSILLGAGLPVTNSYIWSNGSTSPTIDVTEYGEYTVNVFTDESCHYQKTYLIRPYEIYIEGDAQGECVSLAGGALKNFNLSPTLIDNTYTYEWEHTGYDELGNIVYTSASPYVAVGYPVGSYQNTFRLEVTLTVTTPSGCVIIVNKTINWVQDDINHVFLSEYVVNGSETFQDGNYYFEEGIKIENGASLTIENCHVKFTPNYGINITGSNSKLELDNSTLTVLNCDNLLWKGIILEGNPNQTHDETHQPSVNIHSNSTIEYAEVAIKSLSGAVINANGANFTQNSYGIWFDYYNPSILNLNTDASIIENCNFETHYEPVFAQGFNFEEFVHLYRFHDMSILGNTFVNSNYEPSFILGDDRGTGINSVGLNNLRLESGNNFSRLTNAVSASSGASVWIQYNTFNNNYRGIAVKSITNSSVVRWNSFDDANLTPMADAYQILLGACFEPTIAHNSFNNGVVGLYLERANYGTFQVYKNTFTGFKMYSNGNLSGHPTAILNNANNGTLALPGMPTTGAEFKCNTFLDYDYAIAIMDGIVKGEQGEDGINSDAPAGNYFLDDENLMDGAFYVSEAAKDNMGTYNYRYYYHQSPIEYDLGGIYRYTEPIANQKGVDKQVVPIVFDDNLTTGSCPNQSPWGTLSLVLIGQEEELNTTISEISTKEDLLETKVDQGNTELLLSDITIATDDTYTALVQDIEEIDSYLSDATAIEFMDKATNRPVAKAIGLIANSPLPSKAKAKIADLDMDENLKSYIMAQQNGLSKREKDEKEIHQLKLSKYKLLREAVQMAYKDETGEIYSQVIDLLLEQDEWKQKEMAYRMLKNSPRQNEAESVFLELQQDLTKFDGQKQYHMEDYLQLLDLETQIDTLSDSLRVVSITAKEDLLQTIKASEFTEGRVASELLLEEAGLDEKEALFIQLPNPVDENRSVSDALPQKAKTYNFASTPDLIEVYPNPVDDRLTVEYIMFNGMSANTISIYDINGKLMQTQSITKAMDIIDINVASFSTGTYIIAFGKDGASSNSTKFIVK